jgi:phosphoglycerol transferase
MEGAGVGQFRGLIAAAIGVVTFGVLLAGVAWRYGHRCQRLAKKGQKSSLTLQLLASILVLLSFVVHPLSSDLLRHYTPSAATTMTHRDKEDSALLSQQSYRDPKAIQNFHPNKNLVYIYMEGLERTYFDPQIFPDVAPRLRKWEDSNATTAFTGIRQIASARARTGFTMGGIVASQCGIPIVTDAPNANKMLREANNFLPGVTCLGDVLKEAGYRQTFVGGAKLAFAGKGRFFTSHGFDTVLGKDELLEKYYHNETNVPMVNWGLNDDAMLDIAFDQYKTLSASNDPFSLYTLTLDTHDLHPSPSCKEDNVLVGDKTMLDSVRCTDYLVDKFLRRVVNHDIKHDINNTLIVVGSDHLHMSYSNIQKHIHQRNGHGKQRRNSLIVVDNGNGPSVHDMPGTTMDIPSTILKFLGRPDAAFGLGRDLTSRKTRSSRGDDFESTFLKQVESIMNNYKFNVTD